MAGLDAVRYLSFSSGGTRGFSFLGVLDALEDHVERATGMPFDEWRLGVRGVAGASAGSLVAIMFALGLRRAERYEIAADFAEVRRWMRAIDVSLLYRNFGMEDGRGFRENVARMITQGGLSSTSTLGDLKRLLRIDVVCVATDLNTSRPYEMSGSRTPHMSVVDAIYASCCMPFVFAPLVVRPGLTLADGCLSCRLPRPFDDDATLFVDLTTRSAPLPSIEDWPTFLTSLMNCLQSEEPPLSRTLRIDGVPVCEAPTFDLDHTAQDMYVLAASGYVTASDWLLDGRLVKATGGLAVALATTLAAASAVAKEGEGLTEVRDAATESGPPRDAAYVYEDAPGDAG